MGGEPTQDPVDIWSADDQWAIYRHFRINERTVFINRRDPRLLCWWDGYGGWLVGWRNRKGLLDHAGPFKDRDEVVSSFRAREDGGKPEGWGIKWRGPLTGSRPEGLTAIVKQAWPVESLEPAVVVG